MNFDDSPAESDEFVGIVSLYFANFNGGVYVVKSNIDDDGLRRYEMWSWLRLLILMLILMLILHQIQIVPLRVCRLHLRPALHGHECECNRRVCDADPIFWSMI